jgi:hypothetical protein
MSEPSFRLLDLPAELRCEYTYPASLVPIANLNVEGMVYECIEIEASRHVLLQTEAGKDLWWPEVPGSSITFIRPRIPLNILRACRLVNKEAAPILQDKLKEMELLPTKFLVNWSALESLTNCLWGHMSMLMNLMLNRPPASSIGSKAEDLVDRYNMLRNHSSNSQPMRSIEITIILDDITISTPKMKFGPATDLCSNLSGVTNTVYVGPLPDPDMQSDHATTRQRVLVRRIRSYFRQREGVKDAMILGEADFAQHLEELKKYR